MSARERVSVVTPATAFEREVFREALLARSINHQTSARANVLPTNEQLLPCVSMSPRSVTDRPMTRTMEPTTPRTKCMERALRSMGQVGQLCEPRPQQHSEHAAVVQEGPDSRPISRVREKSFFLRSEASKRARDTEYASHYCHDKPGEQLDQMLKMTFNDSKIQRETQVDISAFPRSELRTAVMGWGPHMRQIYMPELRTDSKELHQRYLALGLPHEYYSGEKSVEVSSPGSDHFKEAAQWKPKTAPTGNRRPSIKALQETNLGSSSISPGSASMLATGRRDGVTKKAATEYRGQFCKDMSMDGTLERAQMFMDGPLDFDRPDALDQTKLSIRQRHTRESREYNKYKELVHTKEAAKRDNIPASEVYKNAQLKTLNDPYGTAFNSPKLHRPIHPLSQSPPRIAHLATLQKDIEWQAPGILQSLKGKAGPCEITSQRNGFFGVQQPHSPRQKVRWGHTRVDRRVHYSLNVNTEGKAMGIGEPAVLNQDNVGPYSKSQKNMPESISPRKSTAMMAPLYGGIQTDEQGYCCLQETQSKVSPKKKRVSTNVLSLQSAKAVS